mmetsp:Transcript_67989/g.149245  ORF Transcript_67989/g.149245 Transcript_67989/m.149245 type:complete len:246 (-) Transcript_67989:288-1025(-)
MISAGTALPEGRAVHSRVLFSFMEPPRADTSLEMVRILRSGIQQTFQTLLLSAWPKQRTVLGSSCSGQRGGCLQLRSWSSWGSSSMMCTSAGVSGAGSNCEGGSKFSTETSPPKEATMARLCMTSIDGRFSPKCQTGIGDLSGAVRPFACCSCQLCPREPRLVELVPGLGHQAFNQWSLAETSSGPASSPSSGGGSPMPQVEVPCSMLCATFSSFNGGSLESTCDGATNTPPAASTATTTDCCPS